MNEEPEPTSLPDSASHQTGFHAPVTGPVHTGSGDINIHSVEINEPPPPKPPPLASIADYLGQSSIGRAIKGPLRFTLVFAFVVGSVLFIQWAFPADIADMLVAVYLLALLIWWIAKDEGDE